jgi:hypothetical protein
MIIYQISYHHILPVDYYNLSTDSRDTDYNSNSNAVTASRSYAERLLNGCRRNAEATLRKDEIVFVFEPLNVIEPGGGGIRKEALTSVDTRFSTRVSEIVIL